VLQHQAAFTETLRCGREMRKRVFETLEQRHAHDFGNGREGVRLYEDLLSAVRDAGVPEAAEEFENRFFPLLNPDRARGETSAKETTAVADRRGSGWDWISALCVAAVIVGAFVLGFNALKMTRAEPPTVAEAPIPAAKATEEPASETMTEPVPATAAEQEPSSER
jgi:anti-sigma-K factor RskA